MQLLSATLALSAIPSGGVLASSLGNAAPLGAYFRAAHKSIGSFLQRADPSTELPSFNEQAEAIHKKVDSLELQCKMMQLKDEETLSGLNRELRAVSGQLAGNIALESGAATEAKQERAKSTMLKEQLAKAQSMCQMQQKHLDNSVEALKKSESKAKALRMMGSECGPAALAAVRASVSPSKATGPLASLLQGCGEEEATAWPATSKPSSNAKAKTANACSLGKESPNCALLKSQLETMALHLEDKKDEAITNQRKQVEQCLSREKELNVRIITTDSQYARTSAELVRLTGLKAGLAASRASIQQRLDRTTRDVKKSEQTCKDGIREYKGELEDILGKRQAAANLESGRKVIIQDCHVTEWVGSKCSKSCKKNEDDALGSMNFTRSVTHPAGVTGTACSSLFATLPCGDKPCPVDCAVSEWTEWGACSKACSGGTAKRSRKVTTQMKDGGNACPSIEMRKVCNVGSCSDPCTLKEWTPWSACSRRCKFSKNSAAGRQQRTREVQGNPVQRGGGSSCPAADDKTRLQLRACNKEVCPTGIKCDASQDVLFLLDSSGDPSQDFKEQTALVSRVVKASSQKVRFGVLSYGKEVRILSRITGDRNRLSAMNSYLPPSGGTRNVVKGLVKGRSLFADPGIGAGRPKIAVLLLGGSPASYANAKRASEELRSAGVRVVVGLVDNGNKQARTFACGLASSPCSANVEASKSWQKMAAEPERFLTTICRDLVYPTPAPSRLGSMLGGAR
jgi:hypothetical protein